MLMLVSAFSALLLASTPSPSASTQSLPPVMSSVVAASMPSPEAETVTSPPLTVMKPLPTLSVVADLMPSFPAEITSVPASIWTESAPRRPLLTAFTVTKPP